MPPLTRQDRADARRARLGCGQDRLDRRCHRGARGCTLQARSSDVGGIMLRRFVLFAALLCFGVAFISSSAAAQHLESQAFEPGAPGLGDEYFPLDGNGGYDVNHYDLDLAYDPATDTLTGVATIEARATQNLSSLNLDLHDLTVRSVRVNGERAGWTHVDGELAIRPSRGCASARGSRFASRMGAYRRRSPISRASSTRTMALSRSASPTARPRGTRRTTTRATRRHTRSRSPSLAGSRRSPTVSSTTRLEGRRDDVGLEGPRADGLVPRDDGRR